MGGFKDTTILAFARVLPNFDDGNLRTIYEPVSHTLIGKRLFEMGVGRKAREEIIGVLEAILEANPAIVHSSDGMYSRMEHLTSIQWKNGVVNERARKLFSRIPKGLVKTMIGQSLDIIRRSKPQVLVGLSEEEKMARSDYYPTIAYVETSACNRGCGHCASMATPDLANIAFDEIVRGFERLPPSSRGVLFTAGEPLRWTGTHKGKPVNLGDAFRYLLERFPGISMLTAGTSGINFDDPLEAAAAIALAKTPDHIKQKIHLLISLSDYPHFRMDGINGIEAARKAQRETIRFALENGFRMRFISFLTIKQYESEIVKPVCLELFPGLHENEIEAFRFHGERREERDNRGRAARAKGYFKDAPPLRDWEACLAYSAIRVPPKSRLQKILHMKRLPAAVNLMLSPGGDLAPGCCLSPAHLATISNTGKTYEQIRDDTTAFVKRIKRMKMEGKLSCMGCLGTLDIRDPRRFRGIVGPENAKLIPAEKLRIR